jgi:hypothetical protein
MGHTAWAIMMFVTLMIYLAMIPSDIRKENLTVTREHTLLHSLSIGLCSNVCLMS